MGGCDIEIGNNLNVVLMNKTHSVDHIMHLCLVSWTMMNGTLESSST